jgi:sulfite exporter TauE/SafE
MQRFVSNRVKSAMLLGLVLGVIAQIFDASVAADYALVLVSGGILLWFDLGPIADNRFTRWIRR